VVVGVYLADTTLAGAQSLADKLRRAASGLRPPWDSTQVTLSAGIVEAVAKHEYDSEDIVTDLINRAEFRLKRRGSAAGICGGAGDAEVVTRDWCGSARIIARIGRGVDGAIQHLGMRYFALPG